MVSRAGSKSANFFLFEMERLTLSNICNFFDYFKSSWKIQKFAQSFLRPISIILIVQLLDQ